MSLPSTVIFFKDNKEVKRAFINCGWFCNDKSVKDAVKDSLLMLDEPVDWDTAKAYGMTILNENLKK